MIDVELLGYVHHYGLEVNAITVIRECPVGATLELRRQLKRLYLSSKVFVDLFQFTRVEIQSSM